MIKLVQVHVNLIHVFDHSDFCSSETLKKGDEKKTVNTLYNE